MPDSTLAVLQLRAAHAFPPYIAQAGHKLRPPSIMQLASVSVEPSKRNRLTPAGSLSLAISAQSRQRSAQPETDRSWRKPLPPLA
uniref:Putative secreted protein n=1 Tax=Anopheles marajoara TaxID=58244 RepID=A0A2M4CAR9_9DIPT